MSTESDPRTEEVMKYHIKCWGAAETPASKEFFERAVPVDFSKVLKPPKTIAPHYYIDGTLLPATLGRGYLEATNTINLRENDVVVASYIKSGSTWMQEIVYNLLNQDQLDKEPEGTLDERSPYLELPECGLQNLIEKPSPRILKCHLQYNILPKGSCNKKYKIIAVARNPKDTVVSLHYFLKLVKTTNYNGDIKDTMELFINDLVWYGPFYKHVLGFWERRHEDNVTFVTYEQLQNDIFGEIKKIGKFLNVEVSDDNVTKIAERCGFKQMAASSKVNKNQWEKANLTTPEAKFMRKGKIGDWKNHFDDEMNKKMDEWIEKHFGHTDLKFQFD